MVETRQKVITFDVETGGVEPQFQIDPRGQAICNLLDLLAAFGVKSACDGPLSANLGAAKGFVSYMTLYVSRMDELLPRS